MAPASSSRDNDKSSKRDLAEQYRNEITQRAARGVSNALIAAALQAKGVNISATTIGRRRREWTSNQPLPPRTNGNKVSKDSRPPKPNRKLAGINARRQKIENRTRIGQSAEGIAAALLEQGWTLERGASTVMGLQTKWGLATRDPYRKTKSSSTPRIKEPKAPKVSKREQEREANREQQTSTMHYPTNCSFGPKKRGREETLDDRMDFMADDADDEALPGPAAMSPPLSQPDEAEGFHDVSAEVMSVDILIDLATSTLSAAHNLKDMLLAYQGQSASQNLRAGGLTTLNDLANARKKVREAAGLMLDLAADPGV